MKNKEFNIKCGKFLNWHLVTKDEFEKLKEGDIPKEKILRCIEHLKFDINWNWIMHVLEKIEDSNYSVEISNIGAKNYICYIRSGGTTVVYSRITEEKINSAIDAIDKFISWYEEKTKNLDK